MVGRYNTNSRKTSHWEVFLKNACRLFLKGAFLLQKPPLFQSKLWIEKFARKGAFTDKVFRTLLSANKDSVFGICELFVKSSTKNFTFISTTRLRAVGELSPASS